MLHHRAGLLCALLAGCRAAAAAPQSGPGTSPDCGRLSRPSQGHTSAPRKLHGRFLHITDIHPDPYFKVYSSTEAEAACHRKQGPAGYYGAETSNCDSPISLVNQTFKWIEENLKDEIDFVIWTGDSARHDNDEKIPRTQKQIISQNELAVAKFAEVFGSQDDEDPTNDLSIPIVPTFGNNDVMPHNIMLAGPNKWTSKYLDIWRAFIPEAQRHSFAEGGWFYVEVVPNQLAVVSLNTLYFFDSNSGVDGCANKHEPGYEHMEWLRIQLQILRERGLKVILIGHVPPARTDSKESWDETCWQKFTLWQRQYRDIIVGNLFGHMNIDHFMLQDSKELNKDTKKGKIGNSYALLEGEEIKERESILEDGEVTVASASDYLLSLRDEWANLPELSGAKSWPSFAEIEDDDEPSWMQWILSRLTGSKKSGKGKKGDKKKYLDKIGGKYGERFSLTNVGPSVVPNYYPTLRVFSYNISSLDTLATADEQMYAPYTPPSPQTPINEEHDFSDDETWIRTVQDIVSQKKKNKERDARKKPKKYKFKVPKPPSKSSPPGPAYSPQSFTLLSYTQYFANLTHINNDFVAQSKTFDNETEVADEMTIFGLPVDENGKIETNKWKEGKHKDKQGKKPKHTPHPKKFKFQVEYDTRDDKLFKLKDLTVRSYIELARRIGHGDKGSKSVDAYSKEENGDVEEEKKKKHKKGKGGKKGKKDSAWFTFVKRAFVGTMDPREIEEVFGSHHSQPSTSPLAADGLDESLEL